MDHCRGPTFKKQLQWNIPNFSQTFPNIFADPTTSLDEKFKLLGEPYVETQLNCDDKLADIYLGTEYDQENNVITLRGAFLIRLSDCTHRKPDFGKFHMRSSIYLTDKDGKIIHTVGERIAAKEGEQYITSFKLMPLHEIWANSELYLCDDTCRLRINFVIGDHFEDLGVKMRGMATLGNDIAKLLETGEGSDMSIHCGSGCGSIIPVHTLILSARSPVFQRMFSTDMKEKKDKTVFIEDVEPRILRRMLEYIYSSSMRTEGLKVDDVYLLIAAADKYQLDELKTFCFQLLFGLMDTDNCGDIAVLVHVHSANRELKNCIYEYCSENWKVLGRVPEFQKMVRQYPDAFLQTADDNDDEDDEDRSDGKGDVGKVKL